jgi:hypothetical protein
MRSWITATRSRLALLLMMLCLAGWPVLAGQERDTEGNLTAPAKAESGPVSLKMIPADAAFYQGWFRCREQVDLIRASRFWAAVTQMPAAKELWANFEKEWNAKDGELARVRIFAEQKENQQLLEVLLDLVSHEIFLYGGNNCGAMLSILSEAVGAMGFAGFEGMFGGEAADQDKARMRALLTVLNEQADDLVVPDLVLGFRLGGDSEAAAAQIRRLELLGGLLVSFVPELKGALQREKLHGGDFLVFNLDFSKLPLKDFNFKEFEEEEDEFEDLLERIKELKVSAALGIKDGCVMLVLGESAAEVLEGMGKGARLLDRAELRPALPLLKQRLVHFSYTSKEMASLGSWDVESFESYKDTLEGWLEESPLNEKQRERLLEDFEKMLKDLEPFQTKPGASVGATVLSASGLEFHSWDYSEYYGREDGKPLTILDHVGGSPIFAYAFRTSGWIDSYRNFSKWTKIGYGWFDELAKEYLPEEMKENYEKVMAASLPILKRLDQITEKKLLPALADGQTALVLDAKLFSKQWQALMPESPKPLPMLELALVCGVADAKLLREAFSDYREAINQLLAKIHELYPEVVPELQIPEPEVAKLPEGTLYYYPLPSLLGLDEQVQPNAGLNDRIATLSLSRDHAARLLKPTRLNSQFEPLRSKRACHAAVHFSFQDLVAGVEPWVEFVITQAPEFQGEQLPEEVRKQIRTALKLARVLGHYESVTYREGSAWFTHGRWTLEDVGK